MHQYQIIEQGKSIDKASKALILLHGRGGTADDILNFAKRFHLVDTYLAAPQATGNSWYPHSFMVEEKLNEPWLSSAIETIKRLVDEISKKIPQSQIVIMGFSQGACLSLEYSSRFASKYGGIVAFSGGLIGSTLNEEKYQGNLAGTKVFIGNSDIDPYIPIERCFRSKELMEKLGATVTLKVYERMGHLINEDEINWVKKNILL
jgi:phospholipase/carboxylesterase